MEENADSMKEEKIRLINKVLSDFSKHVTNGDLSEILLKGHLLIEHYLDHIMLLLFDKKAGLKKKSFYDKVSNLKDTDCFEDHEATIECLFALNRIRNELAHRLDFEVTQSQIDTIGYNLGKDYIVRRYSKDVDTDKKKLLLWVMDQIIFMVYFPIWKNIVDEGYKKKKEK